MKFIISSVFLLFSLQIDAQTDSLAANPTANSCECGGNIFSFAEQMPAFPGNEAGFAKYLQDNLVYPESAIKARHSGTVYVVFTIDSAGFVCDPKAAKDIRDAPELTAEALRVMRASPNWIPGTMNGVNVCVSLTVPIKFKLPE